VIIRQAEPKDAELIWVMHSTSIRELCAGHYSAAQIQAWVGGLSPERYVGAMELFEFLIVEVENQIVGLCMFDLNNGELNALLRRTTGGAARSRQGTAGARRGLRTPARLGAIAAQCDVERYPVLRSDRL